MRLFRLSIKLGPFTWSRTTVKPTKTHPGHPDRPSGFPKVPGWYNVGGQAWYWTGSVWLR